MAINVNTANNQAAQLNSDITKLRDAKRQMQTYRATISNNWQSKEVTYILTAIDNVIRDIDSAINNLESLSGDIKNVAAQIKREEEAAAAAARAKAAQQQRIREAQTAFDDAQRELDALMMERDKLEDQIRRTLSSKSKKALKKDLEALEKTIVEAQMKCEGAFNALQAVKG